MPPMKGALIRMAVLFATRAQSQREGEGVSEKPAANTS